MPRTITNNANLPRPMFNALAHDPYVGGGDISITRLITPPRIVTLRKFHADEIVEDAADKIWSLFGQAVHYINEKSADKTVRVETRLQMPIQGISNDDGILKWQVSGQPDVYDLNDFSIFDYKVTSVWSVIFGGHKDWDEQINLQAMLHRHKGDKVLAGSIIAIMRDWQVRKARFERDYPPLAVKVIPIPLWPQGQAIDFAQSRVRLHQQAQQDYLASGKDVEVLALCTPDERWYRGGSFAVKRAQKTGKVNKKADRLFDTREGAEKYMAENRSRIPTGTTYAPIEERPGENIRCLDYCDVADFCPFGRKLKSSLQIKFSEPTPDEEEATETPES